MHTSIRKLAAFALVTLFLSPDAHALLFRAYVASDGNDANPCTLAAPCRLLPAALTAVASGGEIWMLESANYNTATVNINKSVSILAVPGAVGSIVATARGPGNPGGVNSDVPPTWAPDRTRPLCPFPSVARYAGSGDVERAESWSCVAPR